MPSDATKIPTIVVVLLAACGMFSAGVLAPPAALGEDEAAAGRREEIAANQAQLKKLQAQKAKLAEQLASWQKRLAAAPDDKARGEAKAEIARLAQELRAADSAVARRKKIAGVLDTLSQSGGASTAPAGWTSLEQGLAVSQTSIASKEPASIDYSAPTRMPPTFDKILKRKIYHEWTYFPDKSPKSFLEYYMSDKPGMFGVRVKHGQHISFYRETGNRRTFEQYVHGKLHETSKSWYPDGTMASHVDYKDGKKHGVVLYLWPGGQDPKHISWTHEGKTVEGVFEYSQERKQRWFQRLPTAAESRTISPDRAFEFVYPGRWFEMRFDTKGKLARVQWFLRRKDIGLPTFRRKYSMTVEPYRVGIGGKYNSGYYICHRYDPNGELAETGYLNSEYGEHCGIYSYVNLKARVVHNMVWLGNPKAYACGKWIKRDGTVTDHGPCK